MVDTVKLKIAILKSGKKTSRVITESGLSKQGFYNKMNAVREFNAREIAKLKEVLNLTPEEVTEIFLTLV